MENLLDDTTPETAPWQHPSASATAVNRTAATLSESLAGDISLPLAPSVPSSIEGPKPKDIWDKIDVIGKLLGSILIPVALAAVGFFVNLALQDRAAKQKTVEIAITVLQSKDTSIPELRKWAPGVFQDTVLAANQKLPAAARKELDSAPLPTAGTPCANGQIMVSGICFPSP